MNHFIRKNLGSLGGAGGPKKPKEPPPPYLKPPRLGDLQAISSYEYTETVDLISDGTIDGLVSPKGEYLEDIRLFEGIYVNDVAVRQPIDSNSSTTIQEFDLSFIGEAFAEKFYLNQEFQTIRADALDNLNGEKDGISFSIINGRTNIATSIYQSIENIKSAYSDTSDEPASPFFKQLRLLQAKFNYNSQTEIQNYLLPILPELTQDEYPFVALKISLGFAANGLYQYSIDDILEFDSDIHNQIYWPLESTELQKRRIMLPMRKLNLSYFKNFEQLVQISGDFYLFFYKKDEEILQNGVDAIINSVKKIKLIKPFAKFNIANASFEIRNGDELQKPLSLFSKTYIDTSYNIQLIGPFGKGRPVLSLLNTNQTRVNSEYNPNDPSSISGIAEGSLREFITLDEYEQYRQKHSALFENSDPKFLKKVNQLLTQRGKVKLESIIDSLDETTPGYKTWNESLQEEDDDGYDKLNNIITFTFRLVQGKSATNKPWIVYITITFDRVTGCFKAQATSKNQSVGIGTTSRSGALFSSDTIEIFDINLIRPIQYLDQEFMQYNFNDSILDFIPFRGGLFGPFEKAVVDAVPELNPLPGVFLIDSMYGPYRTSQNIINTPSSFLREFWAVLLRCCIEFAYRPEGSDDFRSTGNKKAALYSYSNWNDQYIKYTSEPAVPVTHLIANPNVDQVYASISVRTLRDTASRETFLRKYKINKAGETTKKISLQKVEAGTPIPSVIRFQIEAGYQDLDGSETVTTSRTYQVKGLVESPVTIDVGREENSGSIQQFSRFILGTENVATPIQLPPAQANRNRFVRVYRTTFESYSSLIRRDVSLDKISEIINLPFSYPYSTICGLKLDARSLSEIPPRSYDARFKKIFVPSNYFPLKSNGVDKRYVLAKNLSDEREAVYIGNWDGTFKMAWTDNPAWIIFDLIINRRYGLGNFVTPEQVNFWELYKIGRYCDAVDENGVFEGVPSYGGGLEPRYSFNGVIADKTNVFDLLKSIVASFRGNMYYSNSEINFTNDRLKPIMAFFNNANVKDGLFNYSNDRRDLQYNVVEVSYLDREDLFKEKIEYIEDPDDIKNRGILRTTAQTFGVTSRAHAKRIGEHIVYSTINEDQTVLFVGGLETLLCRPGDLISINDEIVDMRKYVGRVLSINTATNSIYTNISLKSSDFSSSGLFNEISVLIPTGKNQSSDFYNLAKSPSKLNISELYQTDIPMSVVFQASGSGVADSATPVDYGSVFYVAPSSSGLPLLPEIQVGAPCSVTVANTQQQIYKIQSIRELNLNEYEVIASKFDTGKFAEIEKGETDLLNDFFAAFPSDRRTEVSEGNAELIQNKFAYQLPPPSIQTFITGVFDAQNDTADISGSWSSVDGANAYDVELVTPKYRSIKSRITGTSIVFDDQSEVGRFSLKVTARNTGSYPNPISPTMVAGLKVISYTAPVRSNGIIKGFGINN